MSTQLETSIDTTQTNKFKDKDTADGTYGTGKRPQRSWTLIALIGSLAVGCVFWAIVIAYFGTYFWA